MSETEILLWALATLAAANIAVCVWVFRSEHLTTTQIMVQAAIVWLFPILGAVIVGIVLFSQRDVPNRLTRTDTPIDFVGADGHLGDAASHSP